MNTVLCIALAATFTVENEPIVLGRTEAVTMHFEVDEPPGTEDRPLLLKSNVGSFGAPTRESRGKYTAIYTPPPTRFPQVALIAVWRETGPDAAIDFFRVALNGVTRLPIKAKPGSELQLTAGPEVTKPAVVPKSGEVTVTVVVPPGVSKVYLSAKEPRGLISQRTLTVDEQSYNRLTTALVPHALLADGKSWARLEVFYDGAGDDMPASRIEVKPTAGEVTFVESRAGRFIYRYVAPPGLPDAQVGFTVTVKSDSASTASAALSLTRPPPARMVLHPPSGPLASDGRSQAKVDVLVMDQAGLGSVAVPVEVTANGERLAVVERGNGSYEATYRAPARYPPGGKVELNGVVRGTGVAGQASLQLAAPPVPWAVTAKVSPGAAPADGKTEVEVLLEVQDEAGHGLGGASLSVSSDQGTVSPLTDDGEGRYRATYVAPKAAEGTATLTVRDANSPFERPVTVPLREGATWSLGASGGVAHSLGAQFGPRAGLVVWRSVLLGGLTFGAGVSVGYGFAERTVSSAAGEVSRSQAHFVPASLRLGWELSLGRFFVVAGLGGALAWARLSTSLTGIVTSAWGGGGLAFIDAGVRLGPARVVLEASYGTVPVRTPSFALEALGLGVGLGVRFALR